MVKKLTKEKLIAKDYYLFVNELKTKNFKNDGHLALRVKVRVYKLKGWTTIQSEHPFNQPGIKCTGARNRRVSRDDIEIGTFYITTQNKIHTIHKWLVAEFGALMKIGVCKPWAGSVIPFITSTLWTKNIETGDICIWKSSNITNMRGDLPVLLLQSVNGKNTDKLSVKNVKRAAGGMFSTKCTLVPTFGRDLCINA